MYLQGVVFFIELLLAYILVLLVVPYYMLYPVIGNKPVTDKFMISLVGGNLLVIHVVFLLQFLKISNRVTLFVATAAFAMAIRALLDRRAAKKWCKEAAVTAKRLVCGEYGLRLFLKQKWKSLRVNLHMFHKHVLRGKWLDLTAFLGCFVFNCWYYTYHTLNYYSYGAPDMTVHGQWIQGLVQGKLFYKGVYPYGFHNVTYALREIFGFDTVTVMRFIGPVATQFIMVMLFILIRRMCRSKIPAYFGYIAFCMCNVFLEVCTLRFQFSIPQEYAMLFLYPMAIFFQDFFETRDKMSLWLFGLCFALTFICHFYTTIAAFFLCLAMAGGYFIRFCQKKYFVPILVCGLTSMAIAIAPLALGLAMGTKLEGSLIWATNVLTRNTSDGDEGDASSSEPSSGTDVSSQISNDQVVSEGEGGATVVVDPNDLPDKDGQQGEGETKEDEKPPPLTPARMWEIITKLIAPSAFADMKWFYLFAGMIPVTGFFVILKKLVKRQTAQNRMQFCMAIYGVLLILLCCLGSFGLPELMDLNRARIFLAYAAPLLFAMPLEIFYELADWFKWTRRAASCVLLSVVMGLNYYIYGMGHQRNLNLFYLMQYKGTVEVLYDILENYPKHQWTIVSPVDETNLVWNDGYHYELVDFILNQEKWTPYTNLTIPTKYVFLYIEKKPLVYAEVVYMFNKFPEYEEITYADAMTRIQDNTGLRSSYYEGQRRPIMAKAYYWAQEYQKYFPDTMSLYYEDDYFMVYKIEQNEYYLNNFAINYGPNERGYDPRLDPKAKELGIDWEAVQKAGQAE